MKLLKLVVFSLLLAFGCREPEQYENDDYTNSQPKTEDVEYVEDSLNDGTYQATVSYYNEKANTHSTYEDLWVEVKNNRLVKINWSNGGWLDESHFTPPEYDEGFAFKSDKGYIFTVTLNEEKAFIKKEAE